MRSTGFGWTVHHDWRSAWGAVVRARRAAREDGVMGLTHTRDAKSGEMSKLVFAMRETMAASARDSNLNHAEAINAVAQVMASILAGTYTDGKNREIAISAIPDLIRAYLPAWDQIYADFEASGNK